MRKQATCHPDKAWHSRGLCNLCYKNERRKLCSPKRRPKDKTSQRRYVLKSKYKITIEGFNKLAEAQEYKCAICKETKTLHVDHDHKTGKVRGLLCINCNTGLGSFKDKWVYLESAIKYLKWPSNYWKIAYGPSYVKGRHYDIASDAKELPKAS